MINLNHITLAFGEQTVLKDQDLIIPSGAHIALMGPSGCGKTSLLRLIAGLISPTGGTAVVRSDRISCLFQEPRLLPWLTAEENVNAVLSDRAATLPDAQKWLDAVGLSDAIKKYPHELSGGMQQRVSLARALAYNGEILLLDEPLKGLDSETKADMIRLLRQHTAGKTLLLATHDPEEADALTDTLYFYQNNHFIQNHNHQ